MSLYRKSFPVYVSPVFVLFKPKHMRIMDVARHYPRVPLFGETVKKSIVEEIVGDLRLFDRIIERPDGEDPRPSLLKFLLEKGHMTEKDLEETVHKRLLEAGRRMADYLSRSCDHPDHLESLPTLGYAMKHGAIPPSEWSGFRYDHGDTPEGIMRSADDLLGRVVRQLLTPYMKDPLILPEEVDLC